VDKALRFHVLEEKREQLSKLSFENREKYSWRAVSEAAGKKNPSWYWLVQRWKLDPAWTDVLAMAAYVGVNLDCLRPDKPLSKTRAVSSEEVRRDREAIESGKRKKKPRLATAAAERGGHYGGKKR
jgi:hypothetical protein